MGRTSRLKSMFGASARAVPARRRGARKRAAGARMGSVLGGAGGQAGGRGLDAYTVPAGGRAVEKPVAPGGELLGGAARVKASPEHSGATLAVSRALPGPPR